MSLRGPQKKRTLTQIGILYKLATEGNRSVSKLSKKPLKKYRTNIVKAIEILKKLEIITQIQGYGGNKGKPEKLYKITDKGIEILSKDKRITFTQFWNLVYLIYDAETIKTEIPLEDFFYNYEKNVLGFELDKVSIRWGYIFDFLYELNESPIKLNLNTFILYIIGISKKLSHNLLLKKIKEKFKMENEEIEKRITELVYSQWINNRPARDNSYQLSITGFVLLINYLDYEIRNNTDKHKREDFVHDFEVTIKNSNDITPLISKVCSEIPYLVKSGIILKYFRFIYMRELSSLDPIQKGGTEEIIYFFRVMGKIRRDKITEYSNAGYVVGKDLLDQKKITNHNSKAMQKREYLSHIAGLKIENEEKIIKNVRGKSFSLDDIIEKSLIERVTFEFFSFLLPEINEWKKRDEYSKLNNIENDYHKRLGQWEKFLQANPEIKNLFDIKIKEIKEFEKENLEKLESFTLSKF